MLQKSVEDFAENDIKFKELVKDAVREELKFYKEHNDKQIQIIFEKLQLYREDLRITYKLIQEIIELFGLHKENSELHRKKVDEILSKLQMDYKDLLETQKIKKNKVEILDINDNKIYGIEIHPKELLEVLIKMEAKFRSQRNDINAISESLQSLRINFEIYTKENKTIFEEEEMENDNEALSIKQKIEREIENLDKANNNKVEILDIEGSSDGK